MSGAACVIDYRGVHRFGCPPDVVWSTIEKTGEFERWWGWLHDLRVEGPGLTAGTALFGVVQPPLSYAMRIRVDLGECVRPRMIDATVHGDLEGRAHLELEADRSGTVATATWTIEMMQPVMRAAARLARPVLQWGHDRVVDVTVAGFRRQVEAPQ